MLVRGAPVLIVKGAFYATAEGARQALERRGATVQLRTYDVEVPNQSQVVPQRFTWGRAIFVAMIVIIFIAAIFVMSVMVLVSIGLWLRRPVPTMMCPATSSTAHWSARGGRGIPGRNGSP